MKGTDRLMVFEINCNNSVGAGIPRPIASIAELGGKYPPLRQIA
jgi:hypothetical protein